MCLRPLKIIMTEPSSCTTGEGLEVRKLKKVLGFVFRIGSSRRFHGPYGESATANPMRLLERATVHQGLLSVNWSYVGSTKG